jgi:ATP-dependent Clp protease adaptor protein ClpS
MNAERVARPCRLASGNIASQTHARLFDSRRPALQFELRAPYVSLLSMSCAPRRDGRCLAQIQEVEGITHISSEKAGTITTAEPTIEKETRSEEELDLPWQVIVHNDPVNLMSYVTMVFQRVFGFPREKAERHMLEVHHNGRSIVWSGMREPAELYVQQLHGYLLLATLEKTG